MNDYVDFIVLKDFVEENKKTEENKKIIFYSI